MRLGRTARFLLLLALVAAAGATAAQAQTGRSEPKPPAERAAPASPDEPSDGASPGEALTIYLMTMGPGDHPFYKFGHNALWVHDEVTGKDRVYNYGTFSFGSAALIPKFFLGRFLYSLSRRGLLGTIREYREENRSIVAQKLNLTPAERAALRDFLTWNFRRENRHYRYDYYRDNCSTRVRDALDQVIGGRLRQAATGPGSMSYREHTLRLTSDLLLEYLSLLVVLGPLVDAPVSRWEEAFLPEKLQELVQDVTVPGPKGDEPLVLEQTVLLEAARLPARKEPPRWLGWFLFAGLGAGGSLAMLGWAGRARRGLRIAEGVLLGALGVVAGFLGTSFCLLWALTDHQVAYRNENILQCAPWLFALPVLCVGVARGRQPSTRRALVLCAAAAAASVLGIVLKILPWFHQSNALVIAFALPLWSGAALGMRWLDRAAGNAPRARKPVSRRQGAESARNGEES
jgi:hypothetical protein